MAAETPSLHKPLLLRIQVTAPQAPSRLDVAVLERLRASAPELSRARLKDAFRAGQVWLRGKPARPSELLGEGEHEITLRDWDPASASKPLASAASIPEPQATRDRLVLHEDDELLILNKPSGLPSVPHSAMETDTAVGLALSLCPSLRGIGRDGLEPGLLHRLDTGTSGVLVFAKTSEAYDRIATAWKSEVRKTYRALTLTGGDEWPTVRAHLPSTLKPMLAHDSGSARRMRVVEPFSKAEFRGKPLPTLTHVRETQERDFHETSCPVVDWFLEIETGVMHQIRCTLSHLGYPILGDPIYGPPVRFDAASREKPFLPSRLWLHAWRIELPRKNGQRLSLEAPLPEGWPPSR
jgi:23S rRNA pseudouridine1911/1915/1917 synthase